MEIRRQDWSRGWALTCPAFKLCYVVLTFSLRLPLQAGLLGPHRKRSALASPPLLVLQPPLALSSPRCVPGAVRGAWRRDRELETVLPSQLIDILTLVLSWRVDRTDTTPVTGGSAHSEKPIGAEQTPVCWPENCLPCLWPSSVPGPRLTGGPQARVTSVTGHRPRGLEAWMTLTSGQAEPSGPWGSFSPARRDQALKGKGLVE